MHSGLCFSRTPTLPSFFLRVHFLSHLKVSCTAHVHFRSHYFSIHLQKPGDLHKITVNVFIKININSQIISSSCANVSFSLEKIYLVVSRIMTFCCSSQPPTLCLTGLFLASLSVSKCHPERTVTFCGHVAHLSIHRDSQCITHSFYL